MPWTSSDISSQKGRTFVVTGSNAGIGYATARLLAGKGATVIMACRNADKGRQALADLQREAPGADVRLMPLDLASLASVHQFAETFSAQHRRLDVLINNAGVMMPPFGRTADGFEMQFGTNVLGHFVLTGLLLPLMERANGARIVSLGSLAHWVGRIDLDNLNAQKAYSGWNAYAQSKLANIVFAYELQRRLERKGSKVISLAAHPGSTHSDLGRHHRILKLVTPLAQSSDIGALPSIRAAVDPGARGGEYYGPAGFATISGPAIRQRSSRRSHDPALAAQLWQACEQLTGVRYPA